MVSPLLNNVFSFICITDYTDSCHACGCYANRLNAGNYLSKMVYPRFIGRENIFKISLDEYEWEL